MASLINSFLLLPLFFFFLTTAAPVDDICRQTKDLARCVRVLKSIDERTGTAALPLLEYIAIEAAMTVTGQNKITVHNLGISTKDPNLKGIYKNCENLYLDALDELNFAQGNLEKRMFGKLVNAGGLVERAVAGCAAAARTNAELNSGNADSGVTGEAISIIARNLH